MMLWRVALLSVTAVLACSPVAWAEKPLVVPPVIPQVTPQAAVECTGWHALCSLADDCSPDGVCDCWRVNENYMVVTLNIKNDEVKAATQRRCTNKNPCEVDEAPVCKVIQAGDFAVEGKTYEWISTYSYRGWCENWDPAKCTEENGGAGPWADCMTFPCIENPSNPDRPLSCQCTVNKGEFVGSNGGCDAAGGAGNVMSTIPLRSWDFNNKVFVFTMPGYEFVKGAGASVSSDPIR